MITTKTINAPPPHTILPSSPSPPACVSRITHPPTATFAPPLPLSLKPAMSAVTAFVRKLNLTQMNTPAILRTGQSLSQKVGIPEAGAAARWGVAVGLIVYWMIEPNFEEPSA